MLPPVYRSFVSSGINSRRPWSASYTLRASEPARSRLESESASTESPRGALACFQSLPYILLIGNRAIASSSPAGLLSGRDKAHAAFQEGQSHLCSEWLEAAQILDRLAPRHNGSSELETRAGVSWQCLIMKKIFSTA